MKEEIDTKKCPFCGQNNSCMVENPRGCWCIKIQIPTALQDLVPDDLKRQSCICGECVRQFNIDPLNFKTKVR